MMAQRAMFRTAVMPSPTPLRAYRPPPVSLRDGASKNDEDGDAQQGLGIRAYLHMTEPCCAHSSGAPFTGSKFTARIRAPMKRTGSTGAKHNDLAAASFPH